MSIDIGCTIEGTIIKLADYGAIVRLEGGKTGLIHISQIADTFVRDVKDYFSEQDRVRVRVLSINAKGRYELSTKQVEQPVKQDPPVPEKRKPVQRQPEPVYLGPEEFSFDSKPFSHPPFEDRMTRFMKDSQDRLLDIKRNLETKHGVRKR